MKRTNTGLAAAMLLCFALAGQAVAQTSPAMADQADAPLSEDEAEAQATEEESQPVAIDPAEEVPPDESSGATMAEEDGTATTEGQESESRSLKDKLKRMLLGVLLPAVERRLHKAVDSDDDVSPEADAALESEP